MEREFSQPVIALAGLAAIGFELVPWLWRCHAAGIARRGAIT
jgi:hypothetical protein